MQHPAHFNQNRTNEKGGAFMKKQLWIFAVVMIFLLTTLVSSAVAAKKYTIILGVGFPASDNYAYLSCKRFKDLTEKYRTLRED